NAIEERSRADVKRFVGQLSGARGDLHDYLAEEVVGRMPHELQDFLMRASLLEIVTSEAITTIVDAEPARVIELLAEAEALGLLSRRSCEAERYRFHPLVTEF